MFPPCFKGTLDKREAGSLLVFFQCFLLVCVSGWGPRGQAVPTGPLSMVLTDHPKQLAEVKAKLKSSVLWQEVCCRTALCQSRTNFRTLEQSVSAL